MLVEDNAMKTNSLTHVAMTFALLILGFRNNEILGQTAVDPSSSGGAEKRWWLQPKSERNTPDDSIPQSVQTAREHLYHNTLSHDVDLPSHANLGSRTYITRIPLPPIPVLASNVILIAKPTSSQPFLAEGKSGVFSDLQLTVEKYLSRAPAIPEKSSISVLYSGGIIKTQRGTAMTDIASGSTPLLLGNRYLLFLHFDSSTASYQIERAWDVSSTRPKLLDENGNRSGLNDALHVDTLTDLETKVANEIASQPLPKSE